jgi:membrane protease YdiL (CAAX protease family)
MKQRFTEILFLFLLALRFADGSFFYVLFDAQTPDWFMYLYYIIIYSSIVTLIWLNKNRLSDMNIDRWFIVLILIAGAFLFLFYLPPSIGIVVLSLMAFTTWSLINAKLNLATFNVAPWKLFVYVFVPLIPVISGILYNNFFVGIKIYVDTQSMLSIIINRDFLGIAYEEILFRGVLWMLLVDLKLSPRAVLLVQALLFWLSHYQLFFEGSYYTFWITLPFISLTYGIIVFKSKSISATSLCHLINNIATVIANSRL